MEFSLVQTFLPDRFDTALNYPVSKLRNRTYINFRICNNYLDREFSNELKISYFTN